MSRSIDAVRGQRVAPPAAQFKPMPVGKLVAEWQSGLETVNGCSQWKLRLTLADLALPPQARV